MTFNTGETTETLKSEYNPEGSVLRKCQLRLLDMLCYFDSVCKKIGIEYGLDGGNVLGAVRHGGFIPWDDDVDVHIKAEDKGKLVKYMLENPHPQYILQCNKTDPQCYNPWIVIRDLKSEYVQNSASHNVKKYKGLQIDVFTMQAGPIKPLFWIDKKISAFNNNYLAGRIPFLPKIIFSLQEYFINPLFSLMSKFMGNKEIYGYTYGTYCGITFPQNVIFPSSQIEFEGQIFSAPGNVDLYLKTVFKHYMDLPPKNTRNWHLAAYRIDD